MWKGRRKEKRKEKKKNEKRKIGRDQYIDYQEKATGRDILRESFKKEKESWNASGNFKIQVSQ